MKFKNLYKIVFLIFTLNNIASATATEDKGFKYYFDTNNKGIFHVVFPTLDKEIVLLLTESKSRKRRVEKMTNGEDLPITTWYVDGEEIQSSRSFEFHHTFKEQRPYKVKLSVELRDGKNISREETVIPYKMEVPEPDELKNYDEYLGIDSDDDGVMDTSQRLITVYSHSNPKAMKLLKKIARNYRLTLKSDTKKITKLLDENDSYFQCLKDLKTNLDLIEIDKSIKTLTYNTQDRLGFYIKNEDTFEKRPSKKKKKCNNK